MGPLRSTRSQAGREEGRNSKIANSSEFHPRHCPQPQLLAWTPEPVLCTCHSLARLAPGAAVPGLLHRNAVGCSVPFQARSAMRTWKQARAQKQLDGAAFLGVSLSAGPLVLPGGVWPPTALHTSCSSAGDLRDSPRSGDHRPSGWRGHLPPHDHRSRAPLLLPPWDGLGLGPRKGIKRDVFSPFWQQDTPPAAFRTRTKGLLSPLLTPGPALHFRAESKQHSKRLKERTPPGGLKN